MGLKKQKVKNSFETLHEKMDLETKKLEEHMLDSKPWYLKGEIVAQDRDENTVLEEYLDVQRLAKFAPPPVDENVVTEFIRKSIKEQSFDSPAFKIKDKSEFRSRAADVTAVSAQKSLVEDYENLFAKNNLLEREQEDPIKKGIQDEMANLFEKLDALSHLHFVPYKHVSQASVIQSKPALAMEESGPGACATSDLLAPEEVCAPRGEFIKGSTELTASDKRRHRKKLMRIRSKRFAAKPGSQIKSKQAAMARVIKMAHKPGSNIKIV